MKCTSFFFKTFPRLYKKSVKVMQCTVCQSCSVLRSLIIMNIVGSLTVSLAMQTGAGRWKGGRRRLTGLNLPPGSSSFTRLLCVVISAYLKWIGKLPYNSSCQQTFAKFHSAQRRPLLGPSHC